MPFLNPTGIDRPLAISRWIWLSQLSEPDDGGPAQEVGTYCGVTGSSSSVAAGKGPLPLMFSKIVRQLNALSNVGNCRQGEGR